jgi:hypothetical protein
MMKIGSEFEGGTVTTTQASELLVGVISADKGTACDAAFYPRERLNVAYGLQ